MGVRERGSIWSVSGEVLEAGEARGIEAGEVREGKVSGSDGEERMGNGGEVFGVVEQM